MQWSEKALKRNIFWTVLEGFIYSELFGAAFLHFSYLSSGNEYAEAPSDEDSDQYANFEDVLDDRVAVRDCYIITHTYRSKEKQRLKPLNRLVLHCLKASKSIRNEASVYQIF